MALIPSADDPDGSLPPLVAHLIHACLLDDASRSISWVVEIVDDAVPADDLFARRLVGPFESERDALVYADFVEREILPALRDEAGRMRVRIAGVEPPCEDYEESLTRDR